MIGSLIARKYLAPSEPSYWRWDDDAEAVVFNDGLLLAFRAQLTETLEAIQGDGLPPLGAVLLAICASTKSIDDDARGSNAIRDLCKHHEQNGQFVPSKLVDGVNLKLLNFNTTVKALNDRAMTQTALEMVFEGCPVEVSDSMASAVIDVLKAGPPPDLVKGATGPDAFDRLLLDLRTLDKGLEGITPDTVRRRHLTGIEQLPEPAEAVELDLPSHQAALQLIDQLEADEQHAAFGRAARRLHAAIRLPRRLGSPDDMPLGGLSDVTNRGRLDRLLVSELAQDDLTLAIRVASNEALYLRREESHTRLPTRRHLLIDLGLTQWGVPRVISVAAALALHAMGDDQTDLQCWCATHHGVEPVTVHDRDGIEQVLARLEVNLAPTAAIRALDDRLRDDPPSELIMMLADDAASDLELQQALRAWRGTSVHTVAVERSGRVVFSAISPQGRRELGHTQIDPDQLAGESTPKRRSLTDPSRSVDLPAAIRHQRLPLRVPHQVKPGQCWNSDVDGACAYAITPDRRLTRWEKQSYGPVELLDNLPSRTLLWRATDPDAGVAALLGQLGKKPEVFALVIDHDSGQADTLPIELPLKPDDKRLVGITCHRGTLLATTESRVLAIDPTSGRLLDTQTINSALRIGAMIGRCMMMSNSSWYGLAYDGTKLKSYPTCSTNLLEEGEKVFKAFEARGIEGFINITTHARILFPVKGGHQPYNCFKWPARIKQADWSSDGRVVRIDASNSHKQTEKYSLVDIKDDGVHVRVKGLTPVSDYVLQDASARYVFPRSIRIRYQQAGIGPDDTGAPTLYLKTKKVWMRMAVQLKQLTVIDIGKKTPAAETRTFKPIASPAGTKYDLFEACFGDHGRLVLDSRGMLHLQPNDKHLQEATIVIEGNLVSGWCSDGRVFGSEYYTHPIDGGKRDQITGAKAYESVVLPIIEHLS